jgi:2-dehydro-3-deoxyphosphogluconate aldolase/(4S)-4-hydroxy-2-oxoglutarate aldolase
MSEFLVQPNVLCVGGSWLAPTDLLEAGNWDAVTKLAQQAVELSIKSGWQV